MQLRPYQQDLIDRTRQALTRHKSVLLQAPTGAGKTAITVHMMSRAAERGLSSMFLVHQNELLRQTSSALWAQKLEHGMVASGKRASKLPAQVASVQTLVRRLDRYKAPDLIIVDECMVAGTMIKTDRGNIPIESVSVNDRVMCYNSSQELVFSEVSDCWSSGIREIFEIKSKSGEVIRCTANHRVKTNRGWVQAQHLKKQDLLFIVTADAEPQYIKTTMDIRESGCLVIKCQKEQIKNGQINLMKQCQKLRCVVVGAEKKRSLKEVKIWSNLLRAAGQRHHASLNLVTPAEGSNGNIRLPKRNAWLFLERFLATLQYQDRTQQVMLRVYTEIMAALKKCGQSTRLKYYQALIAKLWKLKTKAMVQFIGDTQLVAAKALLKLNRSLSLAEIKKKYLLSGSTKLEISGLLGGYVMMAHAAAGEQACTQRDFQTKNKKQLLHGYLKNTEMPMLLAEAKDTKKYILAQMLRELYCRLLSTTYRNPCNTNWNPIDYVRKTTSVEKVYDITVPGTGNFFANGVLVHNCHRSASKSYQQIFAAYPTARVIGLTATPERTDGKGLGDTYGEIVMGPTITQLIKAGYLCDYELFAPPSALDMSGVKVKMGDYSTAESEAMVDKPTITGDAVNHYLTHAMGKRCVVMAVSIKHGEHVADQYRAAGIPAAMIEGSMTGAEREKLLLEFAAGRILVLVGVQLLIEGLDIPAIEAIQWLRPTQSLIIWMQGNGRGFRTHADKGKLLIFDHVGNWHRHGLPDDDREWSLDGRTAKQRRKDADEAELTIQQCKAPCFAVFRAGVDKCPKCGRPVERKTAREIEQIDGELERIDIEQARRERKTETRHARTLRDLIELGVRRGLNKPAEWAVITIAARSGRKPTAAEFVEAKRVYREIRDGDQSRNANPAADNVVPI